MINELAKQIHQNAFINLTELEIQRNKMKKWNDYRAKSENKAWDNFNKLRALFNSERKQSNP